MLSPVAGKKALYACTAGSVEICLLKLWLRPGTKAGRAFSLAEFYFQFFLLLLWPKALALLHFYFHWFSSWFPLIHTAKNSIVFIAPIATKFLINLATALGLKRKTQENGIWRVGPTVACLFIKKSYYLWWWLWLSDQCVTFQAGIVKPVMFRWTVYLPTKTFSGSPNNWGCCLRFMPMACLPTMSIRYSCISATVILLSLFKSASPSMPFIR